VLAVCGEGHAQLKLKPVEAFSLLPKQLSENQSLSYPLAAKLLDKNTKLMTRQMAISRQHPAVPKIQAYRTAPSSPPDIYQYEELAFFCKWEVKLEQAARIPVKFRLGDVQYVDWLEGKRRDY